MAIIINIDVMLAKRKMSVTELAEKVGITMANLSILERIAIAYTVKNRQGRRMKPYSQDLREKIIRALEAQEETQNEIADRFAVSLSFVEKLWHLWRSTGSCAAKPHAGGQRRRLQYHAQTLRRAVADQPDATLAEFSERLVAAQGPAVSASTICRELQRLKLPLKKSHSTLPSARPHASSSCAPSTGRNSARAKSRA